jgi:hypothetical protein
MESIGTDATPIEVLLVEDSPGDVRLTREAFKDGKMHINLRRMVRKQWLFSGARGSTPVFPART